MIDLLKSEYPWMKFSVVAWWVHALDSPGEKVFLAGDFDEMVYRYLDSYSSELFVFSNLEKPDYLGNTHWLDNNEIYNSKYDAIIVDNYNNRICDEACIKQLHASNLSKDGTFCIYEKNQYKLFSNESAILKQLLNVLMNYRLNTIKELINTNLIHFPSLSYREHPYESYVEGRYFTNKNIFKFKERLKIALLRSRLSRLFVNSCLLIANSNESKCFHQKLLRLVISEDQASDEFQLTNILYKYGKVIFSFSGISPDIKPIVVIVVHDLEGCIQRDNELEVLRYLEKIDDFKSYLPTNYRAFSKNGYKIYVMEQIDGVTVDIDSKHTQKMTTHAAACLNQLAKLTCHNYEIKQHVLNWINTLPAASDEGKNKLGEIQSFINTVDFEKSICMHGDAKLENFVLDSDNNVAGIIDWEQAMINGFPMLDLFYLFAYNFQMRGKGDFSAALNYLCNEDLLGYEETLQREYMQQNDISAQQKNYLLVVFFVHHYTKRYVIIESSTVDLEEYEKSLTIIVNYIGKRNG